MLRFRSRVRVFSILVMFSMLAAPSLAEPQSSAQPSAEELFRDGRETMKRGDFALACSTFKASYAISPAKSTLLNLAICSEKLGRVADAQRYFLQLLARPDLDEARRAIASEQAHDLEKRVPHLVIRLRPSDRQRTLITLDGSALGGDAEQPIAVNPGAHTVGFEAKKRDIRRVSIKVAEGELRVVDSPAPPLNTGRPKATQKARGRAERSRGSKTSAYWIGGLGLLGLATSAVMGVLVLEKKSVVDAHCTNGECDDDGLQAARAGQTLSDVGTAAFGAGVALTGCAAFLFLRPDEASSQNTGSDVHRVRMEPAFRLSLRGAF